MNNITQLQGKTDSELQAMAKAMGIKNAEKTERQALIYNILDEQAIAGAANTANKEVVPTTKHRGRPRKQATQSPAKEPEKTVSATDDAPKEPAQEKKRRPGRPRKEQSKEAANAKPVAEQSANQAKPAEVTPPQAPQPEEAASSPAANHHNKPAYQPHADAPHAAETAPQQEKEEAQGNNPQQQHAKNKQHQPQKQSGNNNQQPNNNNQQRSNNSNNPNNNQQRQPQPQQHAQPNQPRKQAEESQMYDFGDALVITGVLETMPDGCGFLRSADYNYMPSPDDVFVPNKYIRNNSLRPGDTVEAVVRFPNDREKCYQLQQVIRVNGLTPEVVRERIAFEHLTPIFPEEKFILCAGDKRDSVSSRIVDLFAPIGKGQRGLIVAQPKTGKTLLLKDIANSISANHPEVYMIILLIDERPEEVTDMQRSVNAEVIASTFDEPASQHVKISDIVLEKAKRMVECGHDVVILLDSITRLARAHNTVAPGSGKILSGGVDANALHKPKRFFGAARKIENGGSLTILATALIDTGSKMDEVIFEEFKGTGNMELQLDRSLSNKRIFPAVNIVASSTRRDDLLQDKNTLNRMWIVRKHIADMNSVEAMNLVKNLMERTDNNEEFLISVNS